MPRLKKRTPQRIMEELLAERGWRLAHRVYAHNVFTRLVFAVFGRLFRFRVESEVADG